MVIGTLLFPIVGTVIGAYMGKNRMEHEREHGKEITDPTIFNKDMILGGLLAPTVTGLVGVAITIALTALTVASGGDFSSVAQAEAAINATTGVAAAGMAITQMATLAAFPIGALLGGWSGQSDMESEKSQAISQLQSYAMSQHFGKSQQPELAQEADRPSRKFTTMIEQQRMAKAQMSK
jgi:hypothetical protein